MQILLRPALTRLKISRNHSPGSHTDFNRSHHPDIVGKHFFLSNAGSYGKILLLGQTKDTTLIAYLAVGAVLVGYELLNFFWAASPYTRQKQTQQSSRYRTRAFVLCYHLRRFLSDRHVQSPDSEFSKLAYRCTRRTVYLRWSESHTTAAIALQE